MNTNIRKLAVIAKMVYIPRGMGGGGGEIFINFKDDVKNTFTLE